MADIITVRGFVAGDVRPGTTNGGVNTANFRLGSTDRHYDRATQQWVDGDTNWFTVQAYRQLAGNIAGSVKKGQRVVVMGRLKLRQWERDGRVYNVAQIDAESIGHDLSWGTANYQRSVAQQPANRERDTVAEAAREEVLLVEGRRVDPDTGEFLDDRPTDAPRGNDGPLGVVRDVEETDRYPDAA
ncbi:single-stranded DNA-binding protein [Arthrobacter sp.]|uniref:single-stranded DNA-binding protein n=1 Tax=Arthrobacter sp. TaxID=1667 RepID=UPI00258F8DD2|nr:single-stranded DNA-binding protein [Arthrobacter sp.]